MDLLTSFDEKGQPTGWVKFLVDAIIEAIKKNEKEILQLSKVEVMALSSIVNIIILSVMDTYTKNIVEEPVDKESDEGDTE